MHSGSPKIGEFDPGSPGLEILVSTSYDSSSDKVYLFSSAGALLWSFYKPDHTTEGVAVGDIDDDGCMEIVVNPDCCSGITSVYALDDISSSSNCGDILKPVAGFIPSDTIVCTGECIGFTDMSQYNPKNWQWFFPGAVPDTSTLQNPKNICYDSAGVYSVTHIVSNDNGSDTLTLCRH